MNNLHKISFNIYILVLIGILLTASFFLTIRLNRDYLVDWDECVYAQYANEMKQTGNLLYNSWNGVPNFEKPPLYAVIQQIPLSFGISEFAQRIPSVVGYLLLGAFLFMFVYKYFNPKMAILSVLLFFGSRIFTFVAIHVTTDIGFSLFIFLGFFFWMLHNRIRYSAYLSGMFFSMALLHKGFSILFFLMAIFCTIGEFSNKKEFILRYAKVILTTVVLILPWHAYMILKFGKPFIQEYFIDNLIVRTTSYLIPPSNHILTHAYNLFIDFFPWHFILLTYFFITIKKKNSNARIIAIMTVVPLILFSLVKTRIGSYILPIIPFFAILIAYNFNQLLEKRKLIYNLVFGILFLQMVITMIYRTEFFRNDRIPITRNEAFLHLRDIPVDRFDYLVPVPHRELSKFYKTTIPYHTRYSHTPCAVYYGERRVNVYFNVDAFKKALPNKNKYFMIDNRDTDIVKNLKKSIFFKNKDYTIFSL